MASLKVIRGPQSKQTYELQGQRWVIGRSPECDIVLDVAAVSRRHAILSLEEGKYFVQDLGSRNGTSINDLRVDERAPIRDGDRMLICDVLMQFVDESSKLSLSGVGPIGSSLLGHMGDVPDESSSTIMATIDVGRGKAASWQLSAKPETQLQALIEISNSLANKLSMAEILPRLLESIFKIFVQADRGFVIMRPDPEGPLVPVASKARREEDETNMRISRTIVEQALVNKKAILSADATSDERFSNAQSIADFEIRSLICAPMIAADGQPLGVIQVDTRNQRSRFTDQDLQVLVGIANQAAIAIDNARMYDQAVKQRALQRDLEVARQMQNALLPGTAPDVPGYRCFAYYEAANMVGGDYYDYVLLPDNRFAIVVGDVAGKGVSAAILMAKLSSDVRFWLAREPDPALALGKINEAFSRPEWDDRFVTMVVAVVDPSTNTLTLVNAGHMPPMLRNAAGEVVEIGGDQAGLPIGVIDDYQYKSYCRDFESGEFVVLFTDGFSEAMNSQRELYGIERLATTIGNREVSPLELGPHVLSDVRQFVGGFSQSDDMCLVCFGRE